MNLYRITGILFFSIILLGCQQKISIKKEKLTAINPISYTDVIYKTTRDTVFVSTFDGKIYELIHGESKKQQIAAIDDEIYDMAYNAKKNQLYAATLHSGIVAINTQDGSTIKKLPLKIWAKQLTYNAKNGILATADVKGNHYIWDTYKGFEQIKTPLALKQLQPTQIADNGDIYFNGKKGILVWNHKDHSIIKNNTIGGQLVDVDEKNNYLLISGKEFGYFHTKTDRVVYKQKHPDWPIYVANKDTTVRVPLSLEIISGMMTTDNIYTCALDKSLRKWDKQSGELIETFALHQGTPSAMDISEDESQLVSVDLLGNITFQDL